MILGWGLCSGLVLQLGDPLLLIKFYLLVTLYALLRLPRAHAPRYFAQLLAGTLLAGDSCAVPVRHQNVRLLLCALPGEDGMRLFLRRNTPN